MPGTESAPGRGQPLKFETVEELEVRCNLYLDDCDKEYDTRKFAHGELYKDGKKTFCSECFCPIRSRGCVLVSGELKLRRPYTMTGLAVWLDTSRQTLLNYECRPEFFDTVKRAKQKNRELR